MPDPSPAILIRIVDGGFGPRRWLGAHLIQLGCWLAGYRFSVEWEDGQKEVDPLGAYDNRRDPCPECGRIGELCSLCDGQTHDPCLGHIEGARSACCGHGLGLGHVIIGNLEVEV